MTSLDLLKYAEEHGIIIEYSKLENVKSCAVDLDVVKIIGINDKDMTEAELRTHLAHELGHCELGAFYDFYSPVDNRKKAEYKANTWAIKKLLPKKKFIKALKQGFTEAWQLAEEFQVTEDMVNLAYAYYFNK